MLDDLNAGTPGAPRPPRNGRDAESARRVRAGRDKEVRPVVEREVPLGQQSDRVLASAVHAWLDGELPEAAVRKGEMAKDVEFWRRLSGQMEQRRHMVTPEHIETRIMAALPHHAPQLISPWWRREFVITPVAALALAGALVTVGAATATLLITP
jgi:hypothetical protein